MTKHVHVQIVKYLFAGGAVTALNLSLLYSFTEFFHIYYLISAVMSFCIAFVCSYLVQKFWTFRDHSLEGAHVQIIKYLILQIVNVTLNTTFLFLLVEYAHIWYIFSQMMISVVLAVATFIIARLYIFNPATSR